MDFKNTVIMSSSCVNHGLQLAKQINSDFCIIPSMYTPWTKDIVLFVGAFYSDLYKIEEMLQLGKKVVVMFVGSDVSDMQKDFSNLNKIQPLLERCKKILCVSEQLKKELKDMNIDAEVITLVPNPIDIKLEENRRGILCYLPVSLPFKKWLFRVDIIPEIVKLLPEYDFYICGEDIKSGLKNWHSVGNLTSEQEHEIMSKCAYNLRVTRHDGFPQMFISCAQNGIPTITEYFDAPYALKVNFEKEEDIPEKVFELVQQYKHTDAMKEYYRKEFTVERLVQQLQNLDI